MTPLLYIISHPFGRINVDADVHEEMVNLGASLLWTGAYIMTQVVHDVHKYSIMAGFALVPSLLDRRMRNFLTSSHTRLDLHTNRILRRIEKLTRHDGVRD